MSSSPELVVDWCSYQAAKYAVEHWHYSKVMPVGKLVKIGIWEGGQFIGAIIFARGAAGAGQVGRVVGLDDVNTTVAELARVALTTHHAPVTRIVSVALRMLSELCPGLRLVVSYADPEQGHNGAIYQAGNWVYHGRSAADVAYIDSSGRRWHSRLISKKGYKIVFGKVRPCPDMETLERIDLTPKYRYLYPLDRAMRRQIAPLAKPYPKRGPGVQGDTPADQAGGPGSSPGVRS